MSEHPIFFKPEMLMAIRAGRKTETRRMVKGLHEAWAEYPEHVKRGLDCGLYGADEENCDFRLFGSAIASAVWGSAQTSVSRYQVGDRLWCKEAWRGPEHGGRIIYRMDGGIRAEGPWKPARFMPKIVARIWLEVTGVRAERVQDITEEAAEKEGFCQDYCGGGWRGESARSKFSKYWDKIHGPGARDRNDWVWVYTFMEGE